MAALSQPQNSSLQDRLISLAAACYEAAGAVLRGKSLLEPQKLLQNVVSAIEPQLKAHIAWSGGQLADIVSNPWPWSIVAEIGTMYQDMQKQMSNNLRLELECTTDLYGANQVTINALAVKGIFARKTPPSLIIDELTKAAAGFLKAAKLLDDIENTLELANTVKSG